MVKASWGEKRQCPGCGNRYYDLGKNPSTCPSCGHVHDKTVPVRAKRGRKAAAPAEKQDPLMRVKAKVEKKKPLPGDDEEDINLDEFNDAEEGKDEEEIEEIEEVDEMEVIEDLEVVEADEEMDDDIVLPEADVADDLLIDDVGKVDKEEDGKEEDVRAKTSKTGKPGKSKAPEKKANGKKPAAKPAAKPVKKPTKKPALPARKKKR